MLCLSVSLGACPLCRFGFDCCKRSNSLLLLLLLLLPVNSAAPVHPALMRNPRRMLSHLLIPMLTNSGAPPSLVADYLYIDHSILWPRPTERPSIVITLTRILPHRFSHRLQLFCVLCITPIARRLIASCIVHSTTLARHTHARARALSLLRSISHSS
jgi:hypothetical protein